MARGDQAIAVEGVNTVRLSAEPRGVRAAAGLLRAGELVAFPTETVYGLGADARTARAVAAIFAAKGRPAENPLILHVADLAAAEAVAELPPAARALAEAFWPGPLTLVLPLRPDAGIAEAVTVGQPSVAIRVPDHPIASALLRAFGGPVAAPSANRSGRVSPTRAGHVLEELSGRIAAVVDGGACPVGVESTIVGFSDRAPRLLRAGGVPVEALARLTGPISLAAAHPPQTAPEAPGQFASHYAPRARLRLNAAAPFHGEAWLGFGSGASPAATGGATRNLSKTGDLAEAAANLYAHLRALDGEIEHRPAARARIAVAPIPMTGIGHAINDRLARAAAPRPAAPDEA